MRSRTKGACVGRREKDTLKDFLWRVGFVLIGCAILAALLLSGVLSKATRKGAEQIVPKVDPNKVIQMKKGK